MTRKLQLMLKKLKIVRLIYEKMREANNVLTSKYKVLKNKMKRMLKQE